MDLIRNINSPDYFASLCKALLAAENNDFQTIDDSGGDKGNDGYSESTETLFQIYCPEKPEKSTDATFKAKILTDLNKAKALVDSGKYKIRNWVFVTPMELREEVQTYIREEASRRDLAGIAWASPKLKELLAKHSHLRSQFPDLIQPDVEKKVDVVIDAITSVQAVKKEYTSKTEKRFQQRIDEAKKLLDEHKYVSAKKEYEKIKQEIEAETDTIDPHLYFRVYNNLGVAEQALGNESGAAALFEKAYEAEPSLPMAICKLATARLLQGKAEEGMEIVEKVLEKQPNDENTISVKANLLRNLGRYDELIPFLRSKGKMAWAFTYEGLQKESQGDFDGAMVAWEKVIGLEPKNVEAYLRAGAAVLVGTKKAVQENALPTHKIPPSIREKFTRAAEWLKKAIALSHEGENVFELGMAYTNLSACYVALGMSEEALGAIAEAVRVDPTSPTPYLNKGVTEVRLGRIKDAAVSLQKYKDMGGDEPELDRHLGYCALRNNDLAKAETLLSPLLTKDGKTDLDVAELCLELYSRQLETEKLDALINQLEKEYPDNSQALKIRAENQQRLGSPEANALFQRALENAHTDSDRFFVEADYADYLYEKQDYIKAAELYEKYLSLEEANPATRNYAKCLYDSGQYGALLKWVEKLSPEARKNLLIKQLEGYSNWYLDNLEKAAAIFKELYEKDPANTKYLVFYGMCQFRLGKEREAKVAYDAARNKVSDTADLATLAGGYEYIGERKLAIELTFKALENDPNNPKAHLAYIFTFLRREQTETTDFDEKHIKAFQKSISEFNSRFPEETALKGFEVKDGDISEILKVADQMAEHTQNATALYTDSQAPLAIIPRITGKRPFDVWAAFTVMEGVGIKIAFGSLDEIQAENTTLEKYKDRSVVVDIYPLFILGHLEKLELMTRYFKKVYVHQSVLDELTENVDDRRTALKNGIKSFGKINGQYALTEISPEQVQKTLELLERIRDFLTKNPSVEIRGFSAEQVAPAEKDLIDTMHETTKDTVRLAKELGVPLYTDDRTLRALLRVENKQESFSTQTFAGALLKSQQINLGESFEIQRQMIDFKYEFLAVNGAFIFHELKKAGFDAEKIQTIFTSLAKKETTLESLGVVLADFLFFLTQTSEILGTEKLAIFKELLSQIAVNHDVARIEEATFANIQKKAPPANHGTLKTILRQFFTL